MPPANMTNVIRSRRFAASPFRPFRSDMTSDQNFCGRRAWLASLADPFVDPGQNKRQVSDAGYDEIGSLADERLHRRQPHG